MSFVADSRPRPAARVLHQRAATSFVLLNLDDGEYFALDEVGARVWELCDGSRSVGDVVVTVAAEYDAPLETIRGDVFALLEELRGASLLVESA